MQQAPRTIEKEKSQEKEQRKNTCKHTQQPPQSYTCTYTSLNSLNAWRCVSVPGSMDSALAESVVKQEKKGVKEIQA